MSGSRIAFLPAGVRNSAQLTDAKWWETSSFPPDEIDTRLSSRPVDLMANLQDLIDFHTCEEAVDNALFDIQPRNASTLMAAFLLPHVRVVSQGEKNFRFLLRVFDELVEVQPPAEDRGIRPYPAQRRAILRALQAMAPLVYGSDWTSQETRFLRRYGLPRHHRFVFEVEPRRFGKTVVMCFVAAILLAAGLFNMNIAYYSQSAKTCEETHAQIERLLRPWLDTAGRHRRFIRYNRKGELLHTSSYASVGTGFGEIALAFRTCSSKQAATQNRGQKRDVLLTDEIAFISHEMITQDIMPHTTRPVCAWIAATTPKGENKVCNQLLDVKDSSGDYFFRRTYVRLACNNCLAAKRGDSCYHVMDVIPDHITGDTSLQKAIMSDSEYDEEMHAIGVQIGKQCFEEKLITTLIRLPRVRIPDNVPVTIVAVDPSGLAPQSSQQAAAALVPCDNGEMMLVGISALDAETPSDAEDGIVDFVRTLLRVPGLRDTVIVPIVESNMSFQAQRIIQVLKERSGARIFHPRFVDKDGRPIAGPLTDNGVKHDWIFSMGHMFRRQLVRISDPFVAQHHLEPPSTEIADVATVLEILRQQASNYRYYPTPKGLGWTVSGKGQHERDDVMNAVMIGICNGLPIQSEHSEIATDLRRECRTLGRTAKLLSSRSLS